MLSRSSDPGALGERGDRGLGDLRVLVEAEILESFDQREARVDEASSFASLGAFLDFCFQERGEVRERGLLLAGRFGRERSEPSPDCGEVQLAGVRFDERFERLGLGRGAHLLCSQKPA